MSINKITRKDYPEEFGEFIDDFVDTSYDKHRRDANFYRKSIVHINEQFFPDFPELWGHWETNTYIWDGNYGSESSDIKELTRVEKREKIVKTYEWVPVEDVEDKDSGELPPPE